MKFFFQTRISKLIFEEEGKHNDWDLYIPDVAYSLNIQKQGSTKYSPYFLMFGRVPFQCEKVIFIFQETVQQFNYGN